MTVATYTHGGGPLVATAIHNGHDVSPEILALMAISDSERLREEDPFTAGLARVAPNQVVGLQSRFQFDLNRPRDKAVYGGPDDAWGLNVWNSPLPPEKKALCLAAYDQFYVETAEFLEQLLANHGALLLLDMHSYNYRRSGPDAAPETQDSAPDINVGTGWIDREYWAPVVDTLMSGLSHQNIGNGTLDVRENIKFRGGWFPRWIAERYRRQICPVALEFKKIFMDEWTGTLDNERYEELVLALANTVPEALGKLGRIR